MPKYIILYGKFGRHEDAQGNPVRAGGELRIKRPGDIIELSLQEAQAKHDSVRLANSEEIAAYEQRIATGAAAPTPANQAATGQPRPLPAADGVRLGEPAPPAGKPAAQPVPPAATAQAPAPAAPAPAAPVVPATSAVAPAATATPAAIPAAAPAAPAAADGRPKARGTGKKGGKKKAADK